MGAVRLGCLVWSIFMGINAALSEMNRSMVGFPDGFRGQADDFSEAVYLSVTLCSICVSAVSLVITSPKLRPHVRTRGFIILVFSGSVLVLLNFAVDPVFQTLFPSTGG